MSRITHFIRNKLTAYTFMHIHTVIIHDRILSLFFLLTPARENKKKANPNYHPFRRQAKLVYFTSIPVYDILMLHCREKISCSHQQRAVPFILTFNIF